ncbi:MAG: hypothetical protein WCA35_12550 [Kovacikia sp.]
MSDPNFAQEAGDFAADAAIDTTVDGFVNQAIDGIASHIPGGEMVDQMLKTGVDLEINNTINAEVNKGAGGILGDIEGIFGHSQQ